MGDIYTNPPQSRNEAILRATIDGTEYDAPPQSRMEDLLVELKAAIEQGGGISNYNDLNNKPQINSVTLQGDQSISDLFDGKVDIGVGTVEESGYAELKDENGDRIFRASSANGGASVESGALIGQPGALVLYNGEGGLSSVRPNGGVSLVEVDLPAENGTLALDSQIASSQTPAKAAVVTVPDAAPINAEDITVDITPVQDLHGYDRPWAGGAGKNKLELTLEGLKNSNTNGTWNDNVWTPVSGVTFTVNMDSVGNVISIEGKDTTGIAHDISMNFTLKAGSYILSSGFTETIYQNDTLLSDTQTTLARGNATSPGPSFTLASDTSVRWSFRVRSATITCYPMLRLSTETDPTFAPYSNICPISGWSEVNVTVADDVDNPTVEYVTIIDLDGTRYGGTLDVVSGLLTVDKAFAEYDGSRDEIWYARTGTSAENHCFAVILEGTDSTVALKSNYAEPIFAVDTYGDYECFVVIDSSTRLAAGIRSVETVEAWKAYLAEHPLQVVYGLATPYTIQLTPQQIKMLKGTNTVYADCGDTQLKYQPDNVIGELKGMIQALDARVTALEEAE